MTEPPGANQNQAPGQDRELQARPVVRRPTAADVSRLAEVNTLAWQRAYRGIVPDVYLDSLTRAAAEVRWTHRVESPPSNGACLVAELGGLVASYAVGGRYRSQEDAEAEDTSRWGELWAIYTHPDQQGRGAGRAVHDALLAALARARWSTAALWVLRDNVAAQAWYRARGWQPDGTTSTWSGSGVPLVEVRFVRSLAPPSPSRSARILPT
jgi:ribosomal protein S18 acetylase RimI-like enzyme